MRKFLKLSISALFAALGLITLPAAMANMGAEESNESIDPDYLAGKKAVESQDWKRRSNCSRSRTTRRSSSTRPTSSSIAA